jgi:hypothetical protein
MDGMAPPPPPPPVPIQVTGADQDAHLVLLVEDAREGPPCVVGPSDLPVYAHPMVENELRFRPDERDRVGVPEQNA